MWCAVTATVHFSAAVVFFQSASVNFSRRIVASSTFASNCSANASPLAPMNVLPGLCLHSSAAAWGRGGAIYDFSRRHREGTMRRAQRIAAAVTVGVLLWIGSALGQGKPTCTPQGKV